VRVCILRPLRLEMVPLPYLLPLSGHSVILLATGTSMSHRSF
jgi:hypothetical protein